MIMRRIWIVLLCTSLVSFIIFIRLFVCEIYLVDSPSMSPTIQPTEICLVDKWSGGALLPRRFADIPILNIFTWVKPLRKWDNLNDWGFHRLSAHREYMKGDVILFKAKDDNKILVKRIESIHYAKDCTYYYVLGDNVTNSTDSRHFGLIPDSVVIGRTNCIVFSWDEYASGLKKIRWWRLGQTISKSKSYVSMEK